MTQSPTEAYKSKHDFRTDSPRLTHVTVSHSKCLFRRRLIASEITFMTLVTLEYCRKIRPNFGANQENKESIHLTFTSLLNIKQFMCPAYRLSSQFIFENNKIVARLNIMSKRQRSECVTKAKSRLLLRRSSSVRLCISLRLHLSDTVH